MNKQLDVQCIHFSPNVFHMHLLISLCTIILTYENFAMGISYSIFNFYRFGDETN